MFVVNASGRRQIGAKIFYAFQQQQKAEKNYEQDAFRVMNESYYRNMRLLVSIFHSNLKISSRQEVGGGGATLKAVKLKRNLAQECSKIFKTAANEEKLPKINSEKLLALYLGQSRFLGSLKYIFCVVSIKLPLVHVASALFRTRTTTIAKISWLL